MLMELPIRMTSALVGEKVDCGEDGEEMIGGRGDGSS
jgi:hypothetical protein